MGKEHKASIDGDQWAQCVREHGWLWDVAKGSIARTPVTLILAHGAGFDVREVPVQMTARETGLPSTRGLRLVYHFCRVLVVMSISKGALRRPDPVPGTGDGPAAEATP